MVRSSVHSKKGTCLVRRTHSKLSQPYFGHVSQNRHTEWPRVSDDIMNDKCTQMIAFSPLIDLPLSTCFWRHSRNALFSSAEINQREERECREMKKSSTVGIERKSSIESDPPTINLHDARVVLMASIPLFHFFSLTVPHTLLVRILDRETPQRLDGSSTNHQYFNLILLAHYNLDSCLLYFSFFGFCFFY